MTGRQPAGSGRLGTLVLGAGAGALIVAFAAIAVGGAPGHPVLSDVIQGAAAMFAALACLRVRGPGQLAGWVRGWRLIGIGMLCWAVGDAIWTGYEVIGDNPDPRLSLADLGFLAMVPLVLWGVAELIGLYRGAAMGLVESLLVTGSLFYLSWAVVLGPLYDQTRAPSSSWLEWSVNISYPVGDVAIASATLILLGSTRAPHRRPIILLAVGTLAISIADSLYVAQVATYRSGHPLDAGWVIGFALIGLAGLAAGSGQHRAAPPGPSRVGLILPYLPLSAAAVTSIVLVTRGRPAGLVLTVLLVALFGLVVIRQILALRERQALAVDLRASLRRVQEQQETLNQLAFYDPLTGLANRAMFEERVSAPRRPAPGNTTVMFVDLDGFKSVNDEYGHTVGDAVLVCAAARLRACSRGEDTVARVGGDEFLVIAEGVAPEAVEPIAQRFLTAMRQPVAVDGVEVMVGASIGTASGDTNQIDVHELIRRADAAMYLAKLAGKGRYAAYPSLDADDANRLRASTRVHEDS